MPYPNPCNIRFTHPALDCVHCRVRNFKDSDEKYAECCNKKKTCGCDAISIETRNSSYEWTVTLAMEIRIAEKRMSMMRNEYQAECRCVIDDTYTLRTILDDEARALTEWYESEKTKVFDAFEAVKEDNPDNQDNTPLQ